MDVVTINMPISGDNLRSLAVHTDGSTLSLSWDKGSVVINLYSQILESHTGPARVKKGMFSLPMHKAEPMMWPSLIKRDTPGEDGVSVESGAADSPMFCGICAVPCGGEGDPQTL